MGFNEIYQENNELRLATATTVMKKKGKKMIDDDILIKKFSENRPFETKIKQKLAKRRMTA